MRLLLSAYVFPPFRAGGIADYAYSLARELAKRHDVTVLANSFSREKPSLPDKFDTVYTDRLSLLGFAAAVPKIASSGGFDVVHACEDSAAVFLGRTKAPYIVTSHLSTLSELGWLLRESPANAVKAPKFMLHYLLNLKALQSASKIISGSRFSGNEIKRHYFLGEEPETVYYGVDLKRFRPGKGSGRKILFVGRLSERKGLFTLLNAAKTVDCEFALVGGGELEGKAKKFVERNGLKEKVIFLGPLYGEELARAFRESIFTVIPSMYEGLPLVALESFACGKTVVASGAGGIPELVLDNETGLLFKAGSAGDLSEKISRLLGDDALRKRLERNALEKVKHFSWEQCAEGHLRVYNALPENQGH